MKVCDGVINDKRDGGATKAQPSMKKILRHHSAALHEEDHAKAR
jgi:hypothetical protein